MKGTPLGEGQTSFPSFILGCFFLALALGCGLFPTAAGALGTKKEELSHFDRLAAEATLLNKRGQFDQVITLLEPHKGDKKNNSALFFNELGLAYRQKGKLSEAIRAYQSGLSLAPANPVIMKNLGDAFYLNKEYDQAVAKYQKVLESNPHFIQAHTNLGLAYYQIEKYKEALEEFEIVLKMDPKDEQAKEFKEAILKKLKGQK